MLTALVHIDTLRREYTAAWLLGQELRRSGYQVVYTSRISTPLLLKFFTPSIVIITHTFTLPINLRNALRARGAKVYVNIVEEVIYDETYMNIMYRPDVEVESVDGVFVWSEWAKSWLLKNTKIEKSRVHAIGSIRNSVLQSRNTVCEKIKTIGIIGRFESLNTWDKRHPFIDLMSIDPEDNEDVDARYYFEKKSIDAESFALTCKVIRKMIDAGKSVIIRPHPNEYIKSYGILKRKFGVNIKIDESNDICEFLSKVDVVCGPVSSAYTEAYMAKVPIISLHQMQKYRYSDKNIYDVLDRLNEGAYAPNSTSELAEIIANGNLNAKKSASLEKYLAEFYSFNKNRDPISDLVKIICDTREQQISLTMIKILLLRFSLILIDFLRIIQSYTFGLKKLPISVMLQYHYNRLLHKPNSYMLAQKTTRERSKIISE